MSKLILLLDAGHGLNTLGKRTPDDSMREFHFNSATAEKVNTLLAGYENVEVHFVYDRTGKVDTPLATRTNTANGVYSKLKGDKDNKFLYLSIHANASGSGWNSANGIETFAYETKPTGSTKVATEVQKQLITKTGLANRGVKFADFHVLRESAMDAVLAECGFMTNKAEAELLKSDNYRLKVAQALVQALVNLYGLTAKPAPKPTAPATPAPTVKPAEGGLYYRVVTGSFTDRELAEKRIAELKAKGFDSFLLPYHK
jgi:N-acetylmuramoyl-L-alanine amidase